MADDVTTQEVAAEAPTTAAPKAETAPTPEALKEEAKKAPKKASKKEADVDRGKLVKAPGGFKFYVKG